jgi:hypothetical protein
VNDEVFNLILPLFNEGVTLEVIMDASPIKDARVRSDVITRMLVVAYAMQQQDAIAQLQSTAAQVPLVIHLPAASGAPVGAGGGDDSMPELQRTTPHMAVVEAPGAGEGDSMPEVQGGTQFKVEEEDQILSSSEVLARLSSMVKAADDLQLEGLVVKGGEEEGVEEGGMVPFLYLLEEGRGEEAGMEMDTEAILALAAGLAALQAGQHLTPSFDLQQASWEQAGMMGEWGQQLEAGVEEGGVMGDMVMGQQQL